MLRKIERAARCVLQAMNERNLHDEPPLQVSAPALPWPSRRAVRQTSTGTAGNFRHNLR